MEHELSSKLPPPNDEEPAQLRHDILDELRDHLTCAEDRERRRLQHSGSVIDRTAVQNSVIERFGDPATLARRLWFDAMKGKLMSQRVVLSAFVVLVVLFGLSMWRTNLMLAALVDQNHKTTTAILDRLEQDVPVRETDTPEWVPLKVTLIEEEAAGTPLTAQKVSLTSFHGQDNRLGQVVISTDSQGVADFGKLPYGRYNLSFSLKGYWTQETLTLLPGRPVDLQIIAPVESLHPVRVQFVYTSPDYDKWHWDPKIGTRKDLELCLLVRYGMVEHIDSDLRHWKGNPSANSVVVRRDGIYPVTSQNKLYLDADKMPLESAPTEYRADYFYPGDLTIDVTRKMETIPINPGKMCYSAEWYYIARPTTSEQSEIVLRSVAKHGLKPELQSVLDDEAQESHDQFPISVKIGNPSPVEKDAIQRINVPVNHPGMLDGECLDPQLELDNLIQGQLIQGGYFNYFF